MINPDLGRAITIDGRSCIATMPAAVGHAVSGPYEPREAGRYAVQFVIAPLADVSRLAPDAICAVIEVTSDGGRHYLAQKALAARDFAEEQVKFILPFALGKRTKLEYRVWVSGLLPLQIDDFRRILWWTEGVDHRELARRASFPAEEGADVAFFIENRDYFQGLYDQGCALRIEGDAILLTIGDVSFFVRDRDDINFVSELFFENVYNIQTDRPTCIVDIGMNIGLTSLLLCHKAEVRRIYAFEPFPDTYNRALANIRMNGASAQKIVAYNFGLSDKNWQGEISVPQTSDSGAMSIIDTGQGTPVRISVRDASDALTRIITKSRALGHDVIIKMDCEGSEYAIFESLRSRKLLGYITGFMVEWHAMFEEKSQADLTTPLRRAGFMVFDRSPPQGNGFFYAVNLRRRSRLAGLCRWGSAMLAPRLRLDS